MQRRPSSQSGASSGSSATSSTGNPASAASASPCRGLAEIVVTRKGVLQLVLGHARRLVALRVVPVGGELVERLAVVVTRETLLDHDPADRRVVEDRAERVANARRIGPEAAERAGLQIAVRVAQDSR